jgi:hypothetical protein
MQIHLTLGDQRVDATLEDNATAADFADLLPLTVRLTDFRGPEKIADLPRRLTTTDAPDGVHPAVGDIAYYAPWGNLAIFYRDAGYAEGLIRLGRIQIGVRTLAAQHDPVTLTIDRTRP